jgi:hypothetical protein
MTRLTTTIALVLAAAAPLPALAGRDQVQMMQTTERAIAAKRTDSQARARGAAAAGPAGEARAAKEGPPSRQVQLLKAFHPRRAYGY